MVAISVTCFLWSGESSDKDDSSVRNRHFADCKCIHNIRTNYITTNICGEAALCYWEMWNYKSLKEKSNDNGNSNTNSTCDQYMVQKFACLIGYPKPQYPAEECESGLADCNTQLAKVLYDDCEPIRKERGLPKPEDVDWTTKTENLNYDLKQDEKSIFKLRPSEKPTSNGYYTFSCPVIYRFPHFTIGFLLKEVDPNVEYDETNALIGVGKMLPKYVRQGVNNERILNMNALSIDHSKINWCSIPKNYICIDKELDPDGAVCSETNLESKKKEC